jgi:hypothetical protein
LNITALNFCKKNHILYLAYFPNNEVKVGTAVYERRYERLLEQGAVYALLVAKANGKIIRFIEKQIAELGISSRVSNNYKIKNIMNYESEYEIENILMKKYMFVKSNVMNNVCDYFMKPEFVNNGHLLYDVCLNRNAPSENDLFGNRVSILNSKCDNRYEIVSNMEIFNGNFISVIGNIAIYKKNNKYFAVNIKEFYGWQIEIDLNV